METEGGQSTGRTDADAACGAGSAGAKAGGRADLSSALGMGTAGRLMGKLFALAPRLVEVQDLGAREYGMSYARGRVVAALTVSGPVLMRALSDAVGVTPRTITGLIDALEKDGWVERRAHPTDRRVRTLWLQAAAGPVVDRILEINLAIREEAFAGLAPGTRDALIAALGSIKDNLMLREEAASEPPVVAAELAAEPIADRVAG